MMPRPWLLAIMGSGETAPTMAKVYRLLIDRLGAPSVDAVLLDSPYGFQENAQDISLRTVGYLRNLRIAIAARQHCATLFRPNGCCNVLA